MSVACCITGGTGGVCCFTLSIGVGGGEDGFSFGSVAFFAVLLARVCFAFAFVCSSLFMLTTELSAVWGAFVSFFVAVVLLRVVARAFLGAMDLSPLISLVSAVAFVVARGRVVFFASVLRVRFVVCSFAGALGSGSCDCCSFSTDAIVSITHT